MKFSIKNFFGKYNQIRRKFADLVIFTEEIHTEKPNFCAVKTNCRTHSGNPHRLTTYSVAATGSARKKGLACNLHSFFI